MPDGGFRCERRGMVVADQGSLSVFFSKYFKSTSLDPVDVCVGLGEIVISLHSTCCRRRPLKSLVFKRDLCRDGAN